jgi:hypothetical protein
MPKSSGYQIWKYIEYVVALSPFRLSFTGQAGLPVFSLKRRDFLPSVVNFSPFLRNKKAA